VHIGCHVNRDHGTWVVGRGKLKLAVVIGHVDHDERSSRKGEGLEREDIVQFLVNSVNNDGHVVLQ
jgi:hypothetical protein